MSRIQNRVINVNQIVKYTLSRMCDPTETNLEQKQNFHDNKKCSPACLQGDFY